MPSFVAGNLWGLQGRVVALGSLDALAAELRQCWAALQALTAPAQHATLDAFFSRSVDAAGKGPAVTFCSIERHD